jgi:hypothetical protein
MEYFLLSFSSWLNRLYLIIISLNMFKKQAIGALTLALLSNDAKAVKYRPPPGATPWYKEAS